MLVMDAGKYVRLRDLDGHDRCSDYMVGRADVEGKYPRAA